MKTLSEKTYQEMTSEERMECFDQVIAETRQRRPGDTNNLRSTLVIACRHFTHPFAYELGKEFMRRAAAACGDALDPDGTWPPCRGELWLDEALAGKVRG